MIVKVRSSEALRDLARAYKYRKHDVIISNYPEVELTGGFWDGGSRSSYSLYTPPASIRALPVSRNPPQFGGAAPRTFEIPRGSYVVEGGTFRGKPAHLHIFGIDAERFFCGAAAAHVTAPLRCGLCESPLEYVGERGNRSRFRCALCDETFNMIRKRGNP